MQRYHLFTAFFELAGDRRPRVVGFNQIASGLPEGLALLGIPQQANHRAGKRIRVIRRDEMATVLEREPFGADRSRDHGLGHRQRFENLQPCAAAGPERDNVDGRFANRRPHVVNRAGDIDAGARRDLAQARGGIAADDR